MPDWIGWLLVAPLAIIVGLVVAFGIWAWVASAIDGDPEAQGTLTFVVAVLILGAFVAGLMILSAEPDPEASEAPAPPARGEGE